jgi:hypothetical protein
MEALAAGQLMHRRSVSLRARPSGRSAHAPAPPMDGAPSNHAPDQLRAVFFPRGSEGLTFAGYERDAL